MHRDRALKICVLPVDEAWELWLCERRHRLALVATISVDKALDAWRKGGDIILLTVETIRSGLAQGEIVAPNQSPNMAECGI